MKSKAASIFHEKFPQQRILQDLIDACEIFRREDLKYLEVETLILIASLKLKFLEREPARGSHNSINDYLDILQHIIKPCR